MRRGPNRPHCGPCSSVCPSVRLSDPYGLLTQKPKKRLKTKIGVNVALGGSNRCGNFQFKRSNGWSTMLSVARQTAAYYGDIGPTCLFRCFTVIDNTVVHMSIIKPRTLYRRNKLRAQRTLHFTE